MSNHDMEHSIMDEEVDIRSEIVSHVPRVVLRTKVVLVGDEAVGKTSIVQSLLTSSSCSKQYRMTLGIDFSVKEVAVNSNVTVDLFLYTTGGQSIVNQRHDIMAAPIWAKANYIVCVYDIGSRVSFQNCSKWIQQVRSCSNSTTTANEVPCLLIGNKADFRNEVGNNNSRVEVTSDEARTYAQEHGLEYFECSAFLGEGVDLPFQYIANNWYAMNEAEGSSADHREQKENP